jgi:acetyltransferase-like isoleucine patch superfamily enzyme
VGKARKKLISKYYGPAQIIYGRFFYLIKRVYNKWHTYKSLRKSIQLDEKSTIGIHHSTMFNLSNSKIIVSNGSLKVGIDFGYFDGGIYDSRKDNCRIYMVNSTLEIEGNVSLFPGVVISAINAKVAIKDGTIINGGSHIIAMKDIKIGQNCLLAQGVMIRDNDGHKLSTETGKDVSMGIEGIIIGDHCWLGQRSMVLKGSELKDNVIVAAGAVVTKSVESNNLVAGIPAKVIKENVKWSA